MGQEGRWSELSELFDVVPWKDGPENLSILKRQIS